MIEGWSFAHTSSHTNTLTQIHTMHHLHVAVVEEEALLLRAQQLVHALHLPHQRKRLHLAHKHKARQAHHDVRHTSSRC